MFIFSLHFVLSLAGCIGRHRLKLFRTLYIFLDIEVVVFQFRSIIIINSTSLIFVSSTFSILRPQGPARLLFLNFNQISFIFKTINAVVQIRGLKYKVYVLTVLSEHGLVGWKLCLLFTLLKFKLPTTKGFQWIITKQSSVIPFKSSRSTKCKCVA